MKDSQTAFVATVIEKLESGVAPWVRPWATSGVSDMPQNLVTGRRYNGCNVLTLWMTQAAMGYPTGEWATFKQILSLSTEENKVCVRKGEKATTVWFMSPIDFKKKNADTGKNETEKGFMLKAFSVFNRAQVDGLAPAVVIDAKPFDPIAAAEEYVSAVGADIRQGGDQAFFSPQNDFVQVPVPGAFESPSHYYGTLLHELTHWTGHKSRLDRIKSTSFGSKDYAFEELVAELGAAFNCAAQGIPGTLRHVEYLAHWAQYLRDDPQALWKAASQASKAVAFLDHAAGVDAEPSIDAGETREAVAA